MWGGGGVEERRSSSEGSYMVLQNSEVLACEENMQSKSCIRDSAISYRRINGIRQSFCVWFLKLFFYTTAFRKP